MAGTKPAPSPWSLCGPGCPPERIGEPAGSTAISLNDALRGLMTSPMPVMVPPVPIPDTTMSTLPSVSFHISSAVVRRWTAGLDGLENCCRMTLFGILVASSSALAIAPFIPLAPSVSTRRAPRTLRIFLRSVVIVSGILPYLLRGGAAVDRGVGRVGELLQDDAVRDPRGELLGLGDRHED